MSDLLETVEFETGRTPRAAVIWMHGLGADGHDFAPIVPELDLPRSLPIRFVFPHAPMRPVSINQGMVMRAWYDVRNDRGERREDEPGVRESQRAIEALIERETKRNVAPGRIVLAGFSQGGAIALQTGLRHPARLAGLMALSCFLPLPSHLAAGVTTANRDVPLFMAHGTADSMIPISRGRSSRDALVALGYRVDWREYPMEHSVCPEEIHDISQWLAHVLGE